MAKCKICLISFAVTLFWASATVADPRQSAVVQESTPAIGANADVVVASFAAAEIRQVKSSNNSHWLIVTQTVKSSGDEHDKLWLVELDTHGVIRQKISLSGIAELSHVKDWRRIPIAITATGGIAMLARDEEQHVKLLEFSSAGQLVINRKLRLHIQKTGELLGLQSNKDHWLLFGSRGITRFDREYDITQSWQAADGEIVVAYTLDYSAGIRLVSVTEAGNGFQWQVHSVRSSDLTESARAKLTRTEARHFLVQCFTRGNSETVVVMPDLNRGPATWDLARVSGDGKTKHVSLTIPQNARKAHATRILLRNDRIHFLSIDNGRAWLTAFDSREGRRLHTRALALPAIEADTLVSGLESASNGDRAVVAINYLAAHGKNPIRAAVLIVLGEDAGTTP